MENSGTMQVATASASVHGVTAQARVVGGRRIPVPMLPSEIVRIETAMFFAGVSDKTIRGWAKDDGIGRQATKHAPLQISFPALLMKVDGEQLGLDRLRQGDRQHPTVMFYLDRAISLLEAIRQGASRRPEPIARR